MSGKRLFVGNLPEDVTEQELSTEFSYYGNIISVELKEKINAFDELNKFAFISLDINERDISKCIQEFKEQKFKGKFLSVSLAKENFLDRLKREREEAGLPTSQIETKRFSTKPIQNTKSNLEFENAVKAAKSDNNESSSDETSSDEDDEVVQGKSKMNGHQNKEEIKGSVSIADQKRTKSLHKMADEYKQKQLAIKSALSNVGIAKNRIVFDDGQENTSTQKSNKKSKTLFNEDDDDNNYENDFQIKHQFHGEKGEKLLELQTRYKNDSRFKIDDRFKEDDQMDYENEEIEQNDEGENERQWQLGILENVVGKKFQSRDQQSSANRHKLMTRFDPSREDHKTLLMNTDEKTKNDRSQNDTRKKKKSETLKEKPKIEEIEVSKETFYKIDDNITDIFKPTGESFSLLNMFGSNVENKDSKLINPYQETPQINSTKKNNERNPFRYDSSDSEDEIADLPTKESILSRKIKQDQNGIIHETLFFIDDDPRLLEGAQFFRVVEKGEDAPDIDDCRRDLKKIVKKQMIRSYKKVGKMFKKNKKAKF